MKQYDFFGFHAEVDEIATKNWYAAHSGWGCDCGDCRNFLLLARKRELPELILNILDELGIPPEKATYVCEMYPEADGHCYQFSYRLAGNILAEPETEKQELRSGRCCHEVYPYGAPGFPEPHFDLEFWSTLPWILDDENRE